MGAVVTAAKEWETSKGHGKHSPSFQAKVALEAVEGEGR